MHYLRDHMCRTNMPDLFSVINRQCGVFAVFAMLLVQIIYWRRVAVATFRVSQRSAELMNDRFPAISGCKIFVFDMMRNPRPAGRTPCVRDRLFFDALAQAMRVDHMPSTPDTSLSLIYQQHGWPRVLTNAILTSSIAATRVEDADVIFVDWSCFAEEDILRMHGNASLVGLKDAHNAIQRLKYTHAWAANGGAGFVFAGAHPNTLLECAPCQPCRLLNSYFLVVEPTSACSVSQSRENATIVPYNAIVNIPSHRRALTQRRTRLAWFRGACSDVSSGRSLRRYFASSAANLTASYKSHVLISCKGLSHSETLREMLESEFCLVIAGDGLSSRRISEVMASGCIPVFIGPPWHTRPFEQYIEWGKLSLFFEMSDPSKYVPPSANWKQDHLISSPYLQLPPSKTETYVVDEPNDVLDKLASFTKNEIAIRRQHLLANRQFMLWGGLELGESSLAIQAAIDGMCKHGKKVQMKQRLRETKAMLAGGHLLELAV
jgi:hypothetical protein